MLGHREDEEIRDCDLSIEKHRNGPTDNLISTLTVNQVSF